jgi:hypothetical protein
MPCRMCSLHSMINAAWNCTTSKNAEMNIWRFSNRVQVGTSSSDIYMYIYIIL